MSKLFKAIVRRRDEADDEGCTPEVIWPEELRWVSDWNRFDEDGKFLGGCTSPFETHAEALADAVREATAFRKRLEWDAEAEHE